MALTSNSIITNPLQIVLVDTITHPLIFNCLICLSSCYLERNGYKSFTNTEIINNNNHQIRLQLNEIFLRFNLSSLKELQLIISSISINGDLNNFNIGISGSILLNFINFYDDNLTSFTFSNGLLQLIKDSPELSLQQQQQEPGPIIITSRSNIEYPSFIENLSLFSKSYYFPNYYWMCLTEFKEILEKFKRFITHDYIFPNYHLLNQFLSQVLQIVMQPNNDSSGSPPANHNFPYTYNIHHGKHFKYCFLNNPGIQFHLFNRGLSIQNTSGSGGSTDDFSFRDTIFASYYDLISKNLCKAYEELFKEFPSSAKDDQPNKRTHNNELLPTPIFVILSNENKYQEQDGQLIQWLNIFDQLRKIEFEQIPSISS
ncbi:hypothetical protein K6H11_004663 [Candida tropicalis]